MFLLWGQWTSTSWMTEWLCYRLEIPWGYYKNTGTYSCVFTLTDVQGNIFLQTKLSRIYNCINKCLNFAFVSLCLQQHYDWQCSIAPTTNLIFLAFLSPHHESKLNLLTKLSRLNWVDFTVTGKLNKITPDRSGGSNLREKQRWTERPNH